MTMATSRSAALRLLPKSATARVSIGRRPIAASARLHLPTGSTQTRSIGCQNHPFLSRAHPLLSCAPSSSRFFHSHDHPPPPGPFGTTETAILSAAYKHVPEHGFSTASLALGARDASLPDISTSVLPDGEFGLIRWHLVTQQDSLATKARELFGSGDNNGKAGQGTAGERYTIPEKIEILLWERLMGNADIIGHWQQALAIMAHPTYVPASLKHLAQLADEIVFLAGDKAVDPSWYTSRAGVSAIYASCELFMTSDNSEGFQETRQFLRRRMQEAGAAKGFLGGIGQWIGFQAMGAVNVARSLGMRI